jgi:ATP-dependent protease ClpP protease subunit
MSRINLRGVIVPSEYDAAWASGYIEKGIIMPESRFRSMLAAVPKNEPLEVYVNSPGGSVFSAGEMVNAVREWKAETKQPVVVVLGALTASAASAFSIMVADTIRAHRNAKVMFHGAWTVSIGGKELHQDTAELLEKINGDIKTRLVSKYGMAPERITEWFAEGREGWLSADELLAAGLASEIIEDPSDVIEFPAEALGEIENRGLGIAAVVKQLEVKDAGDTGNGDAGVGKGDTGSQTGSGDVSQSASAAGPTVDAECPAYRAGYDAGAADKAVELAERVKSIEEQCRRLQSDRDKARSEVERLTTAIDETKAVGEKTLAEASARHGEAVNRIETEHASTLEAMQNKLRELQVKCERLVSGGLTFSPDTTGDKVGRTASDVDPRNRLHPALR